MTTVWMNHTGSQSPSVARLRIAWTMWTDPVALGCPTIIGGGYVNEYPGS
jgi:hypothetical protein